MKKVISISICFILILCSFAFAGEINIGVAANFQQCINELIGFYNNDAGVKINCIYGSSGKLFAQIKNGAPIDIFFSANSEYPRKIFEENLASDHPKIYAKGQIVLWSKNKKDFSEGLNIFLDDNIQKIAIADPRIAPYGLETIKALKAQGIWGLIENKIIYGSSIAQVNHFIASNAVDIGITALSAVIMLDESKGHWILLPKELYLPIEQSAVIIKQGIIREEVKNFYDFIFSDRAKLIIKKYGYKVE